MALDDEVASPGGEVQATRSRDRLRRVGSDRSDGSAGRLSDRGQASRAAYLLLAGGLFVLLCAAWIAALHLIRSQGVNLIGDEPHYLVEAVSIGRFHTLNTNPGYNFSVLHHTIYAWPAPPGPHLAAAVSGDVWRHGIYFPYHAIGLSALLALPVLAGPSAAVVTLIVILAGLTVGLVHLTCRASGCASPWRVAVGALFLAPGVALAATQVFPDLLTGLILGIVVMATAGIEVRGRCTWADVWVVSTALVVLPWLDQKNIFFPIPLLVGSLVACGRAKLPRRGLRFVILPPVISLVGLLALNLYGFGHLLGAPEPIQLFGTNTFTRAVALLIDRRQGLFVQVPVALLGLAGLWTSKRRMPVAVVMATLAVVAMIYGNATQPESFGGYSFVGRFQWPALPILLSFSGLYLLDLWRARRAAGIAVTALIGGLFAAQLVPILRHEHVFYNVLSSNPLDYPGWWGRWDLSPVLGYIGNGPVEARAVWRVIVVAVGCGAVVYALTRAVQTPDRSAPGRSRS